MMHFSSVDPFFAAVDPSTSRRSSSRAGNNAATKTGSFVEPIKTWDKVYCRSNCSMYSSASSHESGYISSNDSYHVLGERDEQAGSSATRKEPLLYLRHSKAFLSSNTNSVVTRKGGHEAAQQLKPPHTPDCKRGRVWSVLVMVLSNVVSLSRSPLLVLLLLLLLLVQEQQLRLLYTRGCTSIQALNSCSSSGNPSSKEFTIRKMREQRQELSLAGTSRAGDDGYSPWYAYLLYPFTPPQLLEQHGTLDSWDLKHECLVLYTLSWGAVVVAVGSLLIHLSSALYSVFRNSQIIRTLQQQGLHTRRLSSHEVTTPSLRAILANRKRYKDAGSDTTMSIKMQETISASLGSFSVSERSVSLESEGSLTHGSNDLVTPCTIPPPSRRDESELPSVRKEHLQLHDRLQRRICTTLLENQKGRQNCLDDEAYISCSPVASWRQAPSNVTGKKCTPAASLGNPQAATAGAFMSSRVPRCTHHRACNGSGVYSDSSKRRFSNGPLVTRFRPSISTVKPRQRQRVRYFYIGDSKDSAASISYSSSDESGTRLESGQHCYHSPTRRGSSVG